MLISTWNGKKGKMSSEIFRRYSEIIYVYFKSMYDFSGVRYLRNSYLDISNLSKGQINEMPIEKLRTVAHYTSISKQFERKVLGELIDDEINELKSVIVGLEKKYLEMVSEYEDICARLEKKIELDNFLFREKLHPRRPKGKGRRRIDHKF